MMTKTVRAVVSAALLCAAAGGMAFARGKSDSAAASSSVAGEELEKTAPASEGLKVRVGVLNGPSGIPAAYLIENAPDLGPAQAVFEVFASAQTELPKLIKGELDIGVLPPNVAAKVFTANNGAVVALGISGTGNLFVMSDDESLASFDGLKGKTVTCAGAGATPEYMVRYLLSKHGISADGAEPQVSLDFSVANADIPALLLTGKIHYALVPEPFASVAEMKNPAIRRALNIQNEYAATGGEAQFPMTLLVANAKFASAHKDIVSRYIEAYRKASEWTVANPNKAGVLVQSHTLGLMAPVAAHAIPAGGYTWIPAAAGRKSIEALLSLFLASAPASIGGALPADGFYYNER
ncbi:MAG: ABC transporter substrate-binding protein [Treponema sp.]|nr:ABC transporter substrate-binding protein [Treponema sp.]